jgi:hypothetical protein
MPVTYVVQQGDCINSIADQFGFYDCQTLWKAPENAPLRALRTSPNVLMTGDQVVIPDKNPIQQKCPTGALYKFKIIARKTKVRIALKLKRTVAYSLMVGDSVLKGTTDGSAPLELEIPRSASDGKLLTWPETLPEAQRTEDNADVWQLNLGGLDPPDQLTGAQARLLNMHYYGGPIDGTLSDATRAALKAFQTASGIDPSGELDDATKSALASAHDGG